jgi:carboxypeptidase family protein
MGFSRSLWRPALLAAVALLASAGAVSAQSTHGSIVGTITDETGASVPGAAVTVTNTGTNIARTVVTDRSGYYEVLALVPGTYRVQAELAGFTPVTREGLIVESRAAVRIDVQLRVAARTAEVTVTAATPVIETETAALSDTRTAHQIEALPMLATGALFPFVTTLPGVQVVTAAGSSVFSFNGARSGQSEIMFDGMSSARLNTPLAGNPNTMEMTSELKVHSSNNSAEFGSPGVVNLVSKSGTNAYRGTVFYYHSRDQWNEKNRFQAAKPPLKRHDTGFTIGGPVVVPGVYDGHNRTFFMFSYWRENNPGKNFFSGQVPTASMRNGDLSVMSGTIRDPQTGTLFAGNVIPSDRISPLAQRIQNRFFGLPNVGSTFAPRNWQETVDREAVEDRFDARVDQRIGSANQLFARFNWKGTVQQPLAVNGNGSPLLGVIDGWRAHVNFVLSDTHVTKRMINEFRTGFTRGGNRQLAPLKGRDIIAELGLTGYPDSDYRGIPSFVISGMPVIGYGVPNNLDDHNDIYQFTDTLTWTHANHTFKGGVDLQRNSAHGLDTPDEVFGSLTFTGAITGNAYADFLLGLPARARRATYLGPRSKLGSDVATFVQDVWRVHPALTLEYGIRYEYQFAVHDDDNLMYNFDPATGNLVVPDSTVGSSKINPLLPSSITIVSASQAGFPHLLREPQKGNVVPRAGFAWRLNDKTAVRGGYGMFIDSFGTLLSPVASSPLFGYTAEFVNTAASQPFTIANPFGTGGGTLVGALEAGTSSGPTLNPNIKNPRLHQWSLTVERQIRNWGVRASYIGTRTTNLTYTRNLNLPQPSTTPFTTARRVYPQYANVFYSQNGDGLHSQYHGLQADVERRFGRAFYVQAAWTMSRVMEDIEDVGREMGPTILNPYDVAAERARATYPTHRINGAVVWEVPVGNGRRYLSNANPFVDALAGGWRLSSLFYYDTGRFWTPTFTGADPSGTGTTGSQRADRIASGILPSSERTADRWFDINAFVALPNNIGRFGNSPRNIIEGPSSKVVHLSVAKGFGRADRRNVQVQVNAINAFDIENLDLNGAGLNMTETNKNAATGSAGKLLAIRDGIERFGARTINVEVRFTF